MEHEKPESLAVLEHHYGDPFANTDAVGRINYYGITGYPTAKIDGKRTCVGGSDPGSYNCYIGAYNWEMLFTPSPCVISLDVCYDDVTRLLEVQTWTTVLDVMQNAHLRIAIAESHIYHPWSFLDSLHHVTRKMLPNYQGVFCNAGVGETFYDYQSYTLPSTWEEENCYVVAFVQTDYSPNTVFRVAKADLFPTYVFGDCTGDGIVDIGDVVFSINYLYKAGEAPSPSQSGDVTGDCLIDVGDIVYLINYLYKNGPAPLEGCC